MNAIRKWGHQAFASSGLGHSEESHTNITVTLLSD